MVGDQSEKNSKSEGAYLPWMVQLDEYRTPSFGLRLMAVNVSARYASTGSPKRAPRRLTRKLGRRRDWHRDGKPLMETGACEARQSTGKSGVVDHSTAKTRQQSSHEKEGSIPLFVYIVGVIWTFTY